MKQIMKNKKVKFQLTIIYIRKIWQQLFFNQKQTKDKFLKNCETSNLRVDFKK